MSDIVSGVNGDVTASGFNIDIDGWTTEVQVNEATWHTFGSAWLKRANVSYGMTGQFTGTVQYDAATTAPMPVATGGLVQNSGFEGVTLTLTAETGCTYTGTANIVGVSLARPADNRMTGTFRFAFVGQPTQTWDESAS